MQTSKLINGTIPMVNTPKITFMMIANICLKINK